MSAEPFSEAEGCQRRASALEEGQRAGFSWPIIASPCMACPFALALAWLAPPLPVSTLAPTLACRRLSSALFDQQATLAEQSPLDQCTLFGLVAVHEAGRRAGALRACQHPQHCLWCGKRGEQSLQARRHITPGSHIERLLLDPDQLLHGRIATQHLQQLLLWQRIELFHTHYCYLAGPRPLLACQQIDGHLPAAQ